MPGYLTLRGSAGGDQGLDGPASAPWRTRWRALAACGARCQGGVPAYDTDVYGALVPTRCTPAGRSDRVGVRLAVPVRAGPHARRASCAPALAGSDVLLVDRYLASTAAYGAARLRQSGGGDSSAGYARWSWSASASRRPPAVAASGAPRGGRERAARGRPWTRRAKPGTLRVDDEPATALREVYDQLAAADWVSPCGCWTARPAAGERPGGRGDQPLVNGPMDGADQPPVTARWTWRTSCRWTCWPRTSSPAARSS